MLGRLAVVGFSWRTLPGLGTNSYGSVVITSPPSLLYLAYYIQLDVDGCKLIMGEAVQTCPYSSGCVGSENVTAV